MTHLLNKNKAKIGNAEHLKTLCGIVDYGQVAYDQVEKITCLVCLGRYNGLNMRDSIRLQNSETINE